MTKAAINYNNSIIYKLCCKDTEIKEIYIGSTTNFRRRKCEHKKCCMNLNCKEYFSYKYCFIRENGGIENWDMIQIEQYNAKDKRDLEQKERYYIDEMKSELNRQRTFLHEYAKNKSYEKNKDKKILNKQQEYDKKILNMLLIMQQEYDEKILNKKNQR